MGYSPRGHNDDVIQVDASEWQKVREQLFEALRQKDDENIVLMSEILKKAGFQDVKFKRFTFGLSTLYTAAK